MKKSVLKFYLDRISRINRINDKYSYDDNVIVMGCPRGGTTWLLSLLTALPGTSSIYEPLGLYVPEVKKLGISRWQYIPENAEWDEVRTYFHHLLKGELLTPELVLNRDLTSIHKTKLWITKFIKGNMLLPWLVNTIPLNKVVLVVRHPCAVVASQLKYRQAEQFVNDIFNFPLTNQKFTDLYLKYRNQLSQVNTLEEKLAASWCLANLVPLKSDKKFKWLTVYYEDLVLYGQDKISEIFSSLGLTMESSVIEKLNEPSFATVADSPVLSGKDQLKKWQQQLSKKQIYMIEKTIESFDMDIYHNFYQIKSSKLV